MRSIVVLLILSVSLLLGVEKISSLAGNPFPKPKILVKKEGNTLQMVVEKEVPKAPKKIEPQAIIRKMVLINNRWYEEGDKINGKRIVYVTQKGIILAFKNRREIIKYNPDKKIRGIEIGKSK